MSRSGEQRSPIQLITVGDFDPQANQGIEFDFIGREIAGRYTVRAQIGGGGMADVYRATDEQLGINVALKLLKPRMASDELRARMVQEAQAAAQVRHANLVRVFGTGALDSTAFIVMELLEGPNLEQYLREYRGGRMPCHEALELLLPALDALHEIHERGYVHRDIKTGNIIVTRVPGRPATAIVIDLGLVKPDRALRNATSPPTTEVGRMLCTPGYTSPEQAAGKPVDRRSDIYSMAVTLYRVLAGRLPFHDARGQPLALLAKHIYNEPTMLAEAAGTADIPGAVAGVIEGALSKDPAKRPQTMQEFADELRAAAQPVTSPRTARLRSTRDLLLAFGAGLALAWAITPSTTCPPGPATAMSLSAPAPGSDDATTVQPEALALTAEIAPRVDDLPDEVTPEAHPPAESTNGAPPTGANRRVPPGGNLAYRRALAGRIAEVQACADVAAGGLDKLTVAVQIEPSGRISARLVGEPEAPLSRCIDAALRHTPVAAPSASVSFTHTFTLRPTPQRP
jgi:serine/threonine-protein kinase